MEKQTIRERVFISIFWDDISLEELKEDIATLEAAGVTDMSIIYDDEGLEVKFFRKRLETDEEYQKRMKEVHEHTQRTEEYERKRLAGLKAKYES